MRTVMRIVLLGVASCAMACSSPGSPANGPPSGMPSRTSGVPSTTPTAAQAGTDEPARCAETSAWGTDPKEAPAYTTDALFNVRAGQHECYDRLVFDVNGPADVGYFVRYVPLVSADGSGEPVPVAGAAALEVVVHAPAQGFDDSGHQPGRVLARTGDYFYTESQLNGWRSLRAVRFAGFFEGQCTIAVGVRDTLPFKVFTQLDTANQARRLVLDLAHRPLG